MSKIEAEDNELKQAFEEIEKIACMWQQCEGGYCHEMYAILKICDKVLKEPNMLEFTEKLEKLRKEAEELKIDNELFKISVRNKDKIMDELSDNFEVLLKTIAKLRDKLYRIHGIAVKINMGEGDAQELSSRIKKIIKEEEQ